MKLLMHILKNNENLKIDNETLSINSIRDKLNEEYRELDEELIKYRDSKGLYNLKNIMAETFDVIQICILILYRAHKEAKRYKKPNLVQQTNLEHKDKLITERRWNIVTGIEIEVKE